MKRINVAIMGCGAVAQIYHVPILQRMPEVYIKTLIDIKKERCMEIKKKLGLRCEISTDYHMALQDNEVDAVFVLTPPKYHADITIEAAESSKHIFCEKPLATSLADAERMMRKIERSGVKFLLGMTLRFIPQYKKIHDLIIRRFLGNIISASSTHVIDISRWPSRSGFQFMKKEGGGALFETGHHHIDLLMWYFGSIKRVFAKILTSGKNLNEVDNAVSVFMEFNSGITAYTTIGWSPLSINEVRMLGDKAFVYATASKYEVLYTGRGFVTLPPIKIKVKKCRSPYQDEFKHFFDCITKDEKPIVSIREGYETLKVVLKAYESSVKGCLMEI